MVIFARLMISVAPPAVLFAASMVFVARPELFFTPSTVRFARSAVRFAPATVRFSRVDVFRYSIDGFLCSVDGFICSVEARNWWIDATSSIDAVNITFRAVLKTDAEAAVCCIGVKLTAARPGKCSFLPNFVVGSAPRSSHGARKTVDRTRKTVDRANKTVGDGRRLFGSGANCLNTPLQAPTIANRTPRSRLRKHYPSANQEQPGVPIPQQCGGHRFRRPGSDECSRRHPTMICARTSHRATGGRTLPRQTQCLRNCRP